MAPTDSSGMEHHQPRIDCSYQYEVVSEEMLEQGYVKTRRKENTPRPQGLVRRLCSVIFGCKPDMDILEWRKGYVKLVAWCWVLISGPFTGWLACAFLTAGNTQTTDIIYMSLFLAFYIFGLLSLAFNNRRWVSRIWLMIGMSLICTMWAKYTIRSFNDDYEHRLTFMWLSTIFYIVTLFLPLTFTDPFLLGILC